jgi:NAD(P)-dependent dehydrogenase (short-subunit alcohol dehydrogenase family)
MNDSADHSGSSPPCRWGSAVDGEIPLGRLGAPDEIAGLIIYLCSEEAAFGTRGNIAINGGQHMQ